MFYILIIILLNLLPLFLLKKNSRFWIFCVPLFIGLMGYYIGQRIIIDKEITALTKQYDTSAYNQTTGDHNTWELLQEKKEEARHFSRKMHNVLLLQAFFTFVLQVVGWRKTQLHYYKRTSWVFGTVFIVFLILWIMMGMEPTGGMVR